MKYEDLKTLDELRRSGAISEAEYQAEKAKILNQSYPPSTEKLYWGMTENSYIALMHVAQFGGYMLPFLGFILPIVMWQINKDNSTAIDRHGKNIVNFMMSWILYAIVGVVLIFTVILSPVGIAILVGLAFSQVVFIILAAVRSVNDEYWKYPLSIELLK